MVNHHTFFVHKKVILMTTTNINIPLEVFNFSGQTWLETWCLQETISKADVGEYSDWLVEEIPLCLQRIKDLADRFPFWQHRKRTGRPPVCERDLLIGFLIRVFFESTFRQTMALMSIFGEYFELEYIPHHTVLSRKNRSKRWQRIWKRFHSFLLNLIPVRKSVIATDATGYSGRKKAWREVPYDVRANQNWIKLHASIETGSFLILNYTLSDSNVHDSKEFENVWKGLPGNVIPVRSLADNAYTSDECLNVVRGSNAIPIHKIRKDAKYAHKPNTAYQKLVHFAKHWPNRYNALYGIRNHAETAFSMIDSRFGYRIRCRNKIGRKNEVQSKINSHNIRALACKEFLFGY